MYSDFAFGFVKDHVVEYRRLHCPDQVRSSAPAIFPEAIAKVIYCDQAVFGENLIQPTFLIFRTIWLPDGWLWQHQNHYASIGLGALGFQHGRKVQVILNGVNMLGVLALGGFSVDRGVLAVNAGSSGYEDPFIELFLRVHQMSEKTAAVRYDFPVGGTPFEIKPLRGS